jgi:hypothetical protein
MKRGGEAPTGLELLASLLWGQFFNTSSAVKKF